MTDSKLNNINFKLEWKSPVAFHTELLAMVNIDLNKDQLPSDFNEKIAELAVGESYSKKLTSKEILDSEFNADKVISFESKYFDINFKGQNSPAIQYRFYPSAIAWEGLETNGNDYAPFRLISINGDKIVADRNHPLAKYYLTLTATKIFETAVSLPKNRPQKDLGKIITGKGPGMQVPFEYGEPIFFNDYPFQLQERVTENKTGIVQPESELSRQVSKLYTQLLPEYSKVLDLMASSHSYLENTYETGLLVGLGSSEDDLSTNERLNTYTVQDLNINTQLPFETNSFDDAICSFCIHGLTDPLALMQEIARVVISGGQFIITFSDKNFSVSSIDLWSQLHPFERMQLVLEYFRQSNLFEDLNTFSERGIAITGGKNKLGQVYAVWGTVK